MFVTNRQKILLVDESESRIEITSRLSSRFHLEETSSAHSAIELFETGRFDCVLISLSCVGEQAHSLITRLRAHSAQVPILMMCSAGDVATVIETVRTGASDFFIREVELPTLAERIDSLLGQAGSTREEIPANSAGCRLFAGGSIGMREVMSVLPRVAPLQATVLILGESGTGKELLARWIHRMSSRAEGPFVAVNLAAIPSELIESTLFGHEKGAFTGAHFSRQGKFGLAQNGTLLLDEITELKLELQAKLLRVLQENEYERVGGDQVLRTNARIVASSNRDIAAAVRRGDFRANLYYRLAVVILRLPPLRERREDIPALVRLFTSRYNQLHGRNLRSFTAEAMAALTQHSWPGNIRELENAVQRAVIIANGDQATTRDMFDQDSLNPEHLLEQVAEQRGSLEDLERQYIEEILRRTGGHQGRAVQILGIDRKTLYNKITRYGLGQCLELKSAKSQVSG